MNKEGINTLPIKKYKIKTAWTGWYTYDKQEAYYKGTGCEGN